MKVIFKFSDNMKTKIITNDPDSPVAKFVQIIWHMAHKDNVSEIILILDKDKFRILIDQKDIAPPPHDLFKPVVKEFISYSGKKVKLWTRSIKDKKCIVETCKKKIEWSMNSENISKRLSIKRN
ncbi:Uncharacterised protein [uncultured archaeon]|nr:Uncharacterised protein [uncultured archaeon]